MGFLIGVGVLILLTIVPVMISAKMLNAAKTGFFSCLIAVVISAVGGAFIIAFFADSLIGTVLSFAFTAVVFSFMLGAKYIQSAIIAVLATVIQTVGIYVLAFLGFAAVSI
ncbi:MAG: hypothetical protein ACI93R_003579 [Flavobacteriales bacterium]|jgi:hypothetical protein